MSDKGKSVGSGEISPAMRQMTMGALFDALHHVAHMKAKGARKPQIKVKERKMPPPYKKFGSSR